MYGSFRCNAGDERHPHGHQYVQNRKCSQAGKRPRRSLRGKTVPSSIHPKFPNKPPEDCIGTPAIIYQARPARAPPPSTVIRTPDAPKNGARKISYGEKVRSGPGRSYDPRGYRRKVVQPPSQRPSWALSCRSLALNARNGPPSALNPFREDPHLVWLSGV